MKVAINGFTGMAPRYASRLLQDTQGSFVANLKATNGNFRGFRGLSQVGVLPPNGSPWRRAKRLYYPGTDNFVWWAHEKIDADLVFNPLANDAFNRVYISAPGEPVYITTIDDIASGQPPATLGIPRPIVAPTINTSGGGGVSDTRAYTYTWITEYGEVSAPAPPSIATAPVDATWQIGIPTADPKAVFVDIYRSQPGNTSIGNYYRVGRVPAGTGSFNDTVPADQVPLLPALDSFANDPPLANLQGLVVHSSGALVGFQGRTVAFSQPYLPHAWPEDYRYTVEHEVVGLAVIDNTVVVLTKGHPTLISGNTPDSVAIIDITDREPCLSKRSIVIIDNKVYFASANGLITVEPGGLGRPTVEILTSEEWKNYSPSTLFAGKYNQWYLGFTSEATGLSISLKPYELPAIVVLDRYDRITGLEVDDRTADVLLIQGNSVFLFDAIMDNRFAVTWRSKEYITPKPMNFGAFQIIFAEPQEEQVQTPLEEQAVDYNNRRFAAGVLDAIGENVIGDGPTIIPPVDPPVLNTLNPPPLAPLGGEPLFDPAELIIGEQIRFNYIADGTIIHSEIIADELVHKLPSGAKYTHHFFELSGSSEIVRIVVGETARELRDA